MFDCFVKSKSTLVIPIWQRSSLPQNGLTLTIYVKVLIWGNSLRLDEDLNFDPFTCVSVANPCWIKSCGDNEKHPMSDKSISINTVCSPTGTPNIIKSPLSFVVTVNL